MCVTNESFRPNYGPGVDLAFNRNEYQEYFLWRPVVRVENLTTFMCRFFRNLGASASKNPQGMSGPAQALLVVVNTHVMFYICCICKQYLLYFSLFFASFTRHFSPLASLSKHVFTYLFLIIVSRLFAVCSVCLPLYFITLTLLLLLLSSSLLSSSLLFHFIGLWYEPDTPHTILDTP
jgi:hypothetical protein